MFLVVERLSALPTALEVRLGRRPADERVGRKPQHPAPSHDPRGALARHGGEERLSHCQAMQQGS